MTRVSFGPRRLLVGLVIALVSFVAFSTPSASAAEDEQSPIVTAALSHLGTHGGQCWTFMRQAVLEATGRTVGFDYRQGFFDAGAVEVSASEARSGDIIQVAKDGNTGAWASYSGLHTAIVMKNLGGGRFNAIDSNQNWDEMVRLRPNYDPYAGAARNGLQVHIYRIPGGSGGGAVAAPAEPATEWAAGDSAVVLTDSGCLNLRSGATVAATKVTCLPSGTPATVIGGPIAADGFTWIQVETSAGAGWVAARYMSKTASALAPVAAAAAAPAEGAASAAAPQPAPVAAPENVLAQVHVDNSPGCLRLRSRAGVGGQIVDCLKAGTALSVLDSSVVSADGYDWLNVRAAAGDGWVAKHFVVE